VVFNIFQVATHFETQFDLSTSFRNFPVRHMKLHKKVVFAQLKITLTQK